MSIWYSSLRGTRTTTPWRQLIAFGTADSVRDCWEGQNSQTVGALTAVYHIVGLLRALRIFFQRGLVICPGAGLYEGTDTGIPSPERVCVSMRSRPEK